MTQLYRSGCVIRAWEMREFAELVVGGVSYKSEEQLEELLKQLQRIEVILPSAIPQPLEKFLTQLCPQIQVLVLVRCELSRIANLGGLPHLTVLNLKENKLRTLQNMFEGGASYNILGAQAAGGGARRASTGSVLAGSSMGATPASSWTGFTATSSGMNSADVNVAGNMRKLREIYLCSNLFQGRLSRSELRPLRRITRFWISRNSLTTAKNLGQLRSAKELNLAGNRIECVTTIDVPKGVEQLNLAHNKIRNFTDVLDLKNLPSLRELHLSDPDYGENPICQLCNYGVALVQYFKQLELVDLQSIDVEMVRESDAIWKRKRLYYDMQAESVRRQGDNAVQIARAFFLEQRRNLLNEVLPKLYHELQLVLQETCSPSVAEKIFAEKIFSSSGSPLKSLPSSATTTPTTTALDVGLLLDIDTISRSGTIATGRTTKQELNATEKYAVTLAKRYVQVRDFLLPELQRQFAGFESSMHKVVDKEVQSIQRELALGGNIHFQLPKREEQTSIATKCSASMDDAAEFDAAFSSSSSSSSSSCEHAGVRETPSTSDLESSAVAPPAGEVAVSSSASVVPSGTTSTDEPVSSTSSKGKGGAGKQVMTAPPVIQASSVEGYEWERMVEYLVRVSWENFKAEEFQHVNALQVSRVSKIHANNGSPLFPFLHGGSGAAPGAIGGSTAAAASSSLSQESHFSKSLALSRKGTEWGKKLAEELREDRNAGESEKQSKYLFMVLPIGEGSASSGSSSSSCPSFGSTAEFYGARRRTTASGLFTSGGSSSSSAKISGGGPVAGTASGQHQNKLDHDHEGLEAAPAWFSATAGTSNSTTATTTSLQDMVANWRSTDTTQVLQRRRQLLQTEEMRLKKMSYSTSASGSAAAWFKQIAAAGGRSRPTSAGASVRSRPGTSSRKNVGGAAGAAAGETKGDEDHGDGETEINHHQDSSSCSESLTVDEQEQILAMQQTEKEIEDEKALKIEARFQRILKSGNVGVREDHNLMSRDTPSRAKGRHGNGDQQFSSCSAIDSEYGGGTGANGSRPVTHAERKRQEQKKREEMINEWTQSVTKQLHEAVRESGGEVFAPDEAEQLFLTLEGGGGGNAGGGVEGSPGGYGRAGAGAGSRPGTVSNNSALQATSALLTSQNWSPYATEFCVFLTNSVAVALYPVLQQFAESDFAQSVFGGEQLDRMSCSQKSSGIGSADTLKKRYLGGAELLVCQAFGMQNELPDVADPFFHYQKESGGASSFGRSTSLAGGGGSSFSSVSGAAGGPSSSPGYDVPGAPAPPAGGTMQNLSNASSFQTASNVRPSTRAPPCGLFSRHHYLFPPMDSEQTYVSRYGLLKRPAQQLPGSSIQIDSLLKANGAHVAQAQAWARRAKPPGGSLGGDPDERPPTTPSSPSPTGRKSRTMLNKQGVGLALASSVVASSGGASGRATGRPEQREQPPPLTGSASPTTGTASGCSPPASPTKSKERAVELAVRTLNTFSLESDGYIDPLRGCGRTTSGASSSSSSAGAGGEGPDGSPLLEPPAMSNFEREWKKLQEAKSARDEEAQATASPAPKVETTRSGSGQHESHLFHSFARSKSLQEFLSSPGYDSVSGRYRTLDSDPRQKIWRFRDASRCEPAFLLQLEFVYDSETEKIECNLVGKNADVGDATKVQSQEKMLSCSAPESVQPTATSLPGDHVDTHTSSTTTASGTEMVATVPPFSGASSSSLRASSSSSASSSLGVPSSSSDPKLLTKIYEKWLGRQVNSTSEELIKRDFGLFWPRLREFAFLVTTVFAHTLAERVLTRTGAGAPARPSLTGGPPSSTSASAAYDVFFETASGALPSHFRPTTTPSVNFNQKTVFDHMTNSHPLGSHTRTHFRVGQFSSAEDLASAWDLNATSDSRTVTQRATLERAVLRERQRILLSLHRVESAQIESITYVNLWGANLRRLSKDCFVGLHKLKTLVLGMNRFVSAAEDLGSSWSCEIVDLSWNFLKPSSRPSSSSICTSSTASEQRPSTSQTERRLFPNCKRLHLTGNAEFHLGTLLHTAAIAEGGLDEWAPKVEELLIDVPEGVFESGSGAVGGHPSRGSCNPYHSAEMQRLLVATHPSLKLVNSMKVILLITNSVVQPPQVVTATAASAVADHDELGGGHKNDASRAAVGLSLGLGGDSADLTENAASASASSDPFRPAAFPTPGAPRAGGGAGKSGCHLSLSPLKEGDGSRIQTSVLGLGVSGGSPTRRRSPAKDLLSGAVSGGAGGGGTASLVRENSNSVGDVSLNASRKTLNVTQMVQQRRAKMQARYSSSSVPLSSSASSSDGRSAAVGAGDVQPNSINNDVPCRSSDEEEDASPDDDADLPAFLCSVLDLADGDEKTSYPRPGPCATAATDFFFQNLQHLIVSNIGLVSLQSSSSFSSTAPSYSISQLCVAQRLETLDISCNKLQSLKGLEAFRQLKQLDASQNAIYCDVLPSLPAGLEFLNLSQNCVKSLAFQVLGDRNRASADHLHTVGIAAPTSYPGLRALYLGDNLLSDMRELQVLPRLFPKLAILELRGNPMCLRADSSVSRDLLDRALLKSCAELVVRKRESTTQVFKKSIEEDAKINAGGEDVDVDAAADEPGSSVSQPQSLAYYERDDQLLENSEDSPGQLSPSSSSDGAGDDHGAPKAFTSLEGRDGDGEGEEGPQEGDNLNDEGHEDQSTTFFDDSCTRLEDRTLRKQKREERRRQREQDRLAKQKAKRESQAVAKPIGRGDVMPKVGMDYSYAASLSSAGTSRPSSSSSASLSLEVMQKAAGARENADGGGKSKRRTNKAASMTAEDLREQELGRNVWGTGRDAHVEHDLQKFFPTERADGSRSGSSTSASAAGAAENDANVRRAGAHAHAPDLLEGADGIDLQIKLAPADDQRREHQVAPADPRGVRNRNHLRVSKLYRLSLIYLLRDSLQYLDGMSITDAELKAAWQTFRTTLTPDLLLQQSGCFYHAKLRALTALNLTSAKLSDLSDGILSDRWLPQLKYLSLDNNVIRTGRIGPLRKLLTLKMNRCCVGELSRFVGVASAAAAVEPNANRICGATSSDTSGGAASGAGGTSSSTSSESSSGHQMQMVDGGAQRIVSSGPAAASSYNINPPTSSSAATTMKPRNRSIFFDSLPKLQHLELSYNQLRSATPFAALGEQIFSELRVLVLAHNQITALAPTRFTARDFPPNPSCPPTAGGIGVVVAATASGSSGATAGGGGVGATTAGGSLTDDEPAAPTPAPNENTASTTTTTSSSTTLRKEQAPFRSLKKLRALILNHNKIRFTDAFSFFQEQRINPTNSSTLHPHGINVDAPALEEIFLTHNRLSSLDCFSAVKNLKLLKLDFNRVSALEAIQLMVPRITVGEKLQETTTRRKRMVKMEELLESMCHTISLARNPVARKPFYRFTLCQHLAALEIIDGRKVTQEDRLGYSLKQDSLVRKSQLLQVLDGTANQGQNAGGSGSSSDLSLPTGFATLRPERGGVLQGNSSSTEPHRTAFHHASPSTVATRSSRLKEALHQRAAAAVVQQMTASSTSSAVLNEQEEASEKGHQHGHDLVPVRGEDIDLLEEIGASAATTMLQKTKIVKTSSLYGGRSGGGGALKRDQGTSGGFSGSGGGVDAGAGAGGSFSGPNGNAPNEYLLRTPTRTRFSPTKKLSSSGGGHR